MAKADLVGNPNSVAGCIGYQFRDVGEPIHECPFEGEQEVADFRAGWYECDRYWDDEDGD